MNGRSIFVLLALSLSSVGVAACSDDSSSQKSSTLKLDGTYRPVDQGAIGSITFANNKDYVLVPSGCGSAECRDVGTYSLDADSRTVYLENATSHRTKIIVLEDIKTGDAAAALIKSVVRTADLVDPGEQLTKNGQETTKGQQQLNGSQQQLNGDQQKLAEKAMQLIETILQAMMNGQGMKKDDQNQDDAKKDEAKKDDAKADDAKKDDAKKDDANKDPNDPNAPPADPNDPNAPKP